MHKKDEEDYLISIARSDNKSIDSIFMTLTNHNVNKIRPTLSELIYMASKML